MISPNPIPAEVRPIEGGPGIDLSMFASRIDPVTRTAAIVPTPVESLASLADRLWMAETTALLITNRTIEDMEWAEAAEGRTFDESRVVERLEPDNRQFFASYLRMFGGTAANWTEWLDLCCAGSPVRFPQPTAPAPSRKSTVRPSSPLASRPSWTSNGPGSAWAPTAMRSSARPRTAPKNSPRSNGAMRPVSGLTRKPNSIERRWNRPGRS
jgi:hypothetical protein